MSLMRFLCLPLLLASSVVAAAEPAPVRLTPAGPWKVDYAESACRLSRPFADGPRSYLLALTQAPVTRQAWVRLGSPEKVAARDAGEAAVAVDGRPLRKPVQFNIYENGAGGTTREFLFDNIRSDLGVPQRALRLSPAKHGTFELDLTTFASARRALDTCMADLHRSMGIDPAQLATIAVDPEGSAYSALPAFDIPYDLQIVYWVAPSGKVDDCKVVKPSGIGRLDSEACAAIRNKASLKPGRTAAGVAVRAPVFEEINQRVSTETSDKPI